MRTNTLKPSEVNAYNYNNIYNNELSHYPQRPNKLFTSTVGDLGDGTLNEAQIEVDLSHNSNQHRIDM